MVSALYSGTVRHRRHHPVRHAFTYRQTLLYLDLDETDDLFARARWWSADRPAPGHFARSDYHGDPRRPLALAIKDTVQRATGRRPAGPVRLLCRARTFGHVFNPVTFAYCYDRAGTTVEAVLAEVTNTPWGERHSYVVGADLRLQTDKVFHVSPLMAMDHRYDVRVTEPAEKLAVQIASSRDGVRVFDATLLLRRRELSPELLDRALLRWPAESLRAMGLIYANALVLRLKGAHWYPHPERI